jgi:phenylacetate-CoA ligase
MSDSSDTNSPSPKLSAPTLYPAELAQLLLLKQQCDRYDKSTLSEIRAVQEQQLAALFRHADRYSSFWHDRLTKAKYSPDIPSQMAFLSQLPTLSRTELQHYFDDIKARWPGLNKTQLITAQSSGSTGQPVRVEKEVNSYMSYYTAISLIEHEWQKRDPRKKLAVLGTGMGLPQGQSCPHSARSPNS